MANKVSDADQKLINRYLAILRKEKYSDSTICRVQSVLRHTAVFYDLQNLTDEEIETIASGYARSVKYKGIMKKFANWQRFGEIPEHNNIERVDTPMSIEGKKIFRREWIGAAREVMKRLKRKTTDDIHYRDSSSLQYGRKRGHAWSF